MDEPDLDRPPAGLRITLIRMTALLAVLGVLLLIPWPLTPPGAGRLAAAGLILIALLALGATRHVTRYAKRIAPARSLAAASERHYHGARRLLRRTGIAPVGLVLFVLFFITWALIYAAVWSAQPIPCKADAAKACAGAFYGTHPRMEFSDFLYLSANLAAASPPPDLFPASRLARAAATLEVVSGIALITLFAGALLGLRAADERTAPARPAASGRQASGDPP
ncbi:MAG: hypothetical protein U0R70_13665 [Solirubrobacteraceae bacterium]